MQSDTDQWTPLHTAASKGHVDIVEALLAGGADVSSLNRDHFTPLHLAAQNGHAVVATALLAGGADVSSLTRDQFTPLHLAAQNGHAVVATALLAGGADVSSRTKSEFTPLHTAASKGHVDIVEALLAGGADVSSREVDQWTPLHLAAQNGHAVVATALLAGGADVSSREVDQWTPLHIAASKGHVDIVEALLAGGADSNATTNFLLLPIDSAVINGRNDVVRMLLESTTVEDSVRVVSTMDWAVMRNQIATLEILVSSEHSYSKVVSSHNADGWNPLQVAVYYNNMKAVKIIVDALQRIGYRPAVMKWSSKSIALAMGRSPTMLAEIGMVEKVDDLSGIDEWLETCHCDDQCVAPLRDRSCKRICLGSGGCGVVYGTAPSNGVGKPVVLKFDKKVHDSMNILFETVVMKHLDHPHIVKVYGYFNDPKEEPYHDGLAHEQLGPEWMEKGISSTDTPNTMNTSEFSHLTVEKSRDQGAKCMVMEWMNQGSLIDWMQPNNTKHITEETVRMLMKQALEALAYLHEPVHTDPFGRKNMALVHHDIKPHNMLIHVGDDGVPVLKLADFGLSRFERNHEHTYHQSIRGTNSYLGPEALPTAEKAQYTPASDIFSWAKTVLEVAAQRVFNDPTPATIKVLLDLVHLTPQSKALIAKCMDKDPTQRPTAKALLKDDYFADDVLFQQWFTAHSMEDLPQQTLVSEDMMARLDDISIHFINLKSSTTAHQSMRDSHKMAKSQTSQPKQTSSAVAQPSAPDSLSQTHTEATTCTSTDQFSSFSSRMTVE